MRRNATSEAEVVGSRKAVVVMIVAAAFGLAACGGSSNSGNTTTTQSSSSSGSGSFADQANGVCKTVNDQSNAITAPGDPTQATASDLSSWDQYLQKIIPILQQGKSQLSGLNPPASDQSGFTSFLNSIQTGITDTQAAQQAASSGDLNGFQQAVQKVANDSNTTNSEASSIGLSVCASNGNG